MEGRLTLDLDSEVVDAALALVAENSDSRAGATAESLIVKRKSEERSSEEQLWS